MIEKIFIMSFFTIGYCSLFWSEMILEKVGDWLNDRLPKYITKPLFSCFICACFWWGTLLYWVLWHNSIQEWFLVVIAAMGVNATIAKLAPSED